MMSDFWITFQGGGEALILGTPRGRQAVIWPLDPVFLFDSSGSKELYWRHEGLDSRHAPRCSPVESKSLCDSDCGRESCSRDWGEHGHLQCCFRDALATASVRKRRSARDVVKR